ncbi:MAG TPA: hypothetical protein VM841_06360 [Actinomycetota bacterium]|nr:hypothetical protein [Actinomycetota bacterium]
MFETVGAINRAVGAVRDAASEATLRERPEVVAALLRGADALVAAAAGLMAGGGVQAAAGRPVEHVLRTEARLTSWDASTVAGAADSLRAMPMLAAAFDEGLVSWSQVRAILAAVKCVRAEDRPTIDALIGEQAKRLWDGSPDRLVDLVADEAARLRPDLSQRREDRLIASSFLAIQGRLDGSAAIYGEADAVSAATIVGALDAVADAPVHPDRGVTRAQQRFDALVQICETTLAGDGSGLRPRSRVLAVIDLKDVDRGGDGGATLLWPLPGRAPRLTPVARDMLVCDAAVTPIVFNGRDVIGAADTHNTFSDRVRSAIVARDRRCRFCSHAAAQWCDVHHIVPGTGNTARDGILLCRRCHRIVHRHSWTATWHDDGAIRFERRGKHFLSLPP